MTGKVEPTVPYYTNMCGWEDNEWPEVRHLRSARGASQPSLANETR
jgi:hypothetical protein